MQYVDSASVEENLKNKYHHNNYWGALAGDTWGMGSVIASLCDKEVVTALCCVSVSLSAEQGGGCWSW